MTPKPLTPVRRDDALALWRDYLARRPTPAPPEDEPAMVQFGDHVELADELVELVLTGTKRATAGLVADFAHDEQPLPRVGGHWIGCDGRGVPRCVLRSTELRLGTLASVDDAFAWDEGEGDRSRDTWLADHRTYFARTQAARGAAWDEDEEVVFERFRVVWPPEFADPTPESDAAPSGAATRAPST